MHLQVASFAFSAHSQSYKSSALANLPRVGIVIEDLSEDGKKCCLSRSDLATSLRFILQQSKLKLATEPFFVPYVYLRVMALRTCTVSVILHVTDAVRSERTGANVIYAGDLGDKWLNSRTEPFGAKAGR